VNADLLPEPIQGNLPFETFEDEKILENLLKNKTEKSYY